MKIRRAFSLILALWLGGALASTSILVIQGVQNTYGLAMTSVSLVLGAQYVMPLWLVLERVDLLEADSLFARTTAFWWCVVVSLLYVGWIAGSLFLQGLGSPSQYLPTDQGWRELANSVPRENQASHNLLWQAYVDHIHYEKLLNLCRLAPAVPALLLRPFARTFAIAFPAADVSAPPAAVQTQVPISQ